MKNMEQLSVKELWDLVTAVYEKEKPDYKSYLNPAVELKEVSTIEEKMGIQLPDELKSLYLCNNGEKENLEGSILGLRFLSVGEMFLSWCDWLYVLKDKELMKACEKEAESVPENAVRKVYVNRKWIPFAHDQEGNYIGIDLDPDENGTVGQIINYGSDENRKYVIAKSLREFLFIMVKVLESSMPSIKTRYKRVVIKVWEDNPIQMIIDKRNKN
ncbi:MAG TPA: SMI1/KNR4 family protein [Pseudobacteroides sp.]|uniref:SMI1/KNR4 family protein n=1 Tax=Pseudobacteroides sp. TaxID=1968840 RepID=UPI002F91EF9A